MLNQAIFLYIHFLDRLMQINALYDNIYMLVAGVITFLLFGPKHNK